MPDDNEAKTQLNLLSTSLAVLTTSLNTFIGHTKEWRDDQKVRMDKGQNVMLGLMEKLNTLPCAIHKEKFRGYDIAFKVLYGLILGVIIIGIVLGIWVNSIIAK